MNPISLTEYVVERTYPAGTAAPPPEDIAVLTAQLEAAAAAGDVAMQPVRTQWFAQSEHGAHLYVDGIHHTNNVESFWRLFKKSVASTHIHISEKYAQRYLDEFTFRSNHRARQNAMFDLLIAAL